jgi:hypothetical protein
MLTQLSDYSGKKILITGHTGFKGSWLSRVLVLAGADVYGLALAPEENSLFEKIDDLIIFMVKALEFDYREMEAEKWKFEYFINHYFLDNKTICIYNKFTNAETKVGNMILTLISIRKFNGKYYCWINIDNYEPAGNSHYNGFGQEA